MLDAIHAFKQEAGILPFDAKTQSLDGSVYDYGDWKMIIDVCLFGDGNIYRYESEVAPRVGETISDPRVGDSYEVTHIDHLIGNKAAGDKYQQLITATVKTI